MTIKIRGEKHVVTEPIADHSVGLERSFQIMTEHGVGPHDVDISAVGHRVVHGGKVFYEPELINDQVVEMIRDIIPLWLLVVLVGRDLFMGVVILLLRRVGQTGLPVHFVGKAATFNLLYAFPILLLSTVEGALGNIARPLGWAFAWWGVVLYLLAAVLYAIQAAAVLRARSAAGRSARGPV